MNLHLYIPPSSEHPPSCIKGTIFSLINRYYRQNTHQQDFIYFASLLYHRTLQRGWNRELIRKLILEATGRAENPKPYKQTTQENNKTTLFLHFQFHKDGMSRQQIRRAYEDNLSSVCQTELNITRAIVAFSRPKNIGDFITKAKLHQGPGKSASTIMGEFKRGLHPHWLPQKLAKFVRSQRDSLPNFASFCKFFAIFFANFSIYFGNFCIFFLQL